MNMTDVTLRTHCLFLYLRCYLLITNSQWKCYLSRCQCTAIIIWLAKYLHTHSLCNRHEVCLCRCNFIWHTWASWICEPLKIQDSVLGKCLIRQWRECFPFLYRGKYCGVHFQWYVRRVCGIDLYIPNVMATYPYIFIHLIFIPPSHFSPNFQNHIDDQPLRKQIFLYVLANLNPSLLILLGKIHGSYYLKKLKRKKIVKI